MGQGSQIELKTGAYFAVALAVLVMPLWLFLSLVIGAAFHEICHYLALNLLGIRVYRISIGPFGAYMETEVMEPGRELLSAFAGPLGSLMLVPFFRWMPGIAFCGLIQGTFNLLPIYPMDGGRILRCLLEILKIPHREKILDAVEWLILLGILVLGLWGKWHWNLGWGGVITGVVLILRIIRRNTSCNESRFGVQ